MSPEAQSGGRRVALVTRAWAPYHRALQEAVAEAALPERGEIGLFYPWHAWCPFDVNEMRPRAANITLHQVDSAAVAPRWMRAGRRWKNEVTGTRLPSAAQWRALRRFAPSEVWIHEFSPYCLGGLFYAKANRLPLFVSTEVGRDNVAWFPAPVRWWHAFWGRLADGWIAQTPAARRPVCGSSAPVVEAYHAADSRKLKPATASPDTSRGRGGRRAVFLQAGRVLERKGADLLLAALDWVNKQGRTDWELRLLGPDCDGWGQRQIARHKLESQVTITGQLDGDALWTAFAEADVFTLATRQDTYAAVVHEAACLGLPLVISRHAGAAGALVRDGVNGWVVDPRDTAAYGARLLHLLDEGVRARMGAESRAIAESCSAHQRGPAVWKWMNTHFGLS